MDCLTDQLTQWNESLHAIKRLYEQYAKSAGLTDRSLRVLEAIYTAKACTQKMICAYTQLPKQTVHVIIRSLWEQGYIEMTEKDDDRRYKEIRLSTSGLKYMDSIIGTLIKIEKDVAGPLTDEQRQTITALLRRLAHALREALRSNQLPY